ncbi:MAG: UDP-N-acetylglucosamine 4,6-dehydratase (inverting) [Candidatus Omnitrophota bacterium]|nr:UDP-N-acetylglucosamine 4,6-dehydratase (inverting) [Candidatus Omnitrophota bacterium]
MLNNKNILITGGTGSLGKKLVQMIVDGGHKPNKLIIFSRDELKQFEMSQVWGPKKYPFIRYFLGDVRDIDRLRRAFAGVDYIIHAAALKQVPAAEYNPCEFVKTNVIGAMNIIEAALSANVKKVVTLSTDKACNPINLYGATKLCSDKLFMTANVYSGTHETKFSVVRYGNVLGSRGSVVPFFDERKSTGVLPITHSDMTRFWITLDQANHFVFFCLENMQGGEMFVPRIPSMRIVDLATAICSECRQEIVGMRPGEKIHEVLISNSDANNTLEFKDFFIVTQNKDYKNELLNEGKSGKRCDEDFEYTSANNKQWLSVADLNKILVAIKGDYKIEQSRWSKEGVPA